MEAGNPSLLARPVRGPSGSGGAPDSKGQRWGMATHRPHKTFPELSIDIQT